VPADAVDGVVASSDQEPSGSLHDQMTDGMRWSYASAIFGGIVQLAVAAATARLLEPAVFGLVAMAMAALRFVGFFAQLGIGRALVQRRSASEAEIRATFTASVVLGIGCAGLCWAVSPLVSWLFGRPDVAPIFRVMALSLVLAGMATTSASLLRRALDFRALAIAETIAYVVGYGGVALVMAACGFGVWSLVGGWLGQNLLGAILCYRKTRHACWPILDWRPYAQLLRFGGSVTLISLVEFLTLTLDTLIIGHFLGATALGIYNRSALLVALPSYQIATALSGVLVPGLSRLQGDRSLLAAPYLHYSRILAALLIPLCLGMSVAASNIVITMFGETWREGIPVLQLLCLGAPTALLSHLAASTCEAVNRLAGKLVVQTAYLVIQCALLLVGSRNGLIGVAVAMVVGEAVRHILMLLILRRAIDAPISRILCTYLPGLGAGALTAAGIWGAAEIATGAHAPAALVLAAEIVTGAVLAPTAILVLFPALARDLATLLGVPRLLERSVFRSVTP
jgi:O-antigen/teichoic acid export membrane protein